MLKQSLLLRVLLICFLFLAMPLLIFSFVYFNHAFNTLIERANWDLEQAALYRTISLKETAPVSNSFLKELKHLLDLENQISHLPNPEFTKKLQQLTTTIPEVDVYVLDKGSDGHYRILASDVTEVQHTGINPPDFISYHSLHHENEDIFHYIRFYYSDGEKKKIPYVYSVMEIYAPDSKNPKGYLVIQKNIQQDMDYVIHPLKASKEPINFALLDSFQFISDASDPNLVGVSFQELPLEKKYQILEQINLIGDKDFFKEPLKIKTNKNNSNLFEFVWDGEVQLAALPLHHYMGDEVFAYVSKKQIFKKALYRFLGFYIAFGVIGVFGTIITYMLTQRMSRPLVQLLGLMENVRKGNLTARFHPEKLGFELNSLGLIFNNTLDSIFENMQRGEEERLQKESYRREIDIGKRVQQALLPKIIPDVKGIKLHAAYFASREVGGDFYDFFYRENNLFLICADASGLGLSPCLYALDVRSFFRAYGLMHSDVGELMRLVNNAFCDDTEDSGMFATAIAAVYHSASKVLSYYSAGHIPSLIRKKNGEIIQLEKRGMALGLVKAEKYISTSMILEEGDVLLMFTQGLVELLNEQNRPFSFNRIKDLLQMRDWKSPKEIVDGLQQEVKAFIGNARNSEEYSILVMTIE